MQTIMLDFDDENMINHNLVHKNLYDNVMRIEKKKKQNSIVQLTFA